MFILRRTAEEIKESRLIREVRGASSWVRAGANLV
jgi:hypothetical protein